MMPEHPGRELLMWMYYTGLPLLGFLAALLS